MQNLGTSYRPPTGSSSDSEESTSQHQKNLYASERARFLFGQYRKGDANDPDTYVACVAAVLSDYPMETIRFVTDPRTGISTHQKFRAFMPNPGEVKHACEEHFGPSRYAKQWETNAARQLAARDQMEGDSGPRLTREQLREKFAHLKGYRRDGPGPIERLDSEVVRKHLGKTQAEWDAIADQPANFGNGG